MLKIVKLNKLKFSIGKKCNIDELLGIVNVIEGNSFIKYDEGYTF